MGLFDLKDNHLVLHPDALSIPPFREIWERDESKDKSQAYKELCYIFHTCDFKSPYAAHESNRREKEVIKDFIKEDGWKPDDELLLCVDKYKSFQSTHSMRLLASAREVVDKMCGYFEEVDFTLLDDNDRPVYNAKDVTANIEKIGKIIESLDKVEEKVKKEITSQSHIRGGGEAGMYER
jgi:mevalonate pyrophosphate decarboxylase